MQKKGFTFKWEMGKFKCRPPSLCPPYLFLMGGTKGEKGMHSKLSMFASIALFSAVLIFPEICLSAQKRGKAEQDMIAFKIGATSVSASLYSRERTGIVYFNMHDNENTCVEAVKSIVDAHGGYFVELKAQGKRLITFHLKGRKYIFDPNRVFTSKGTIKTLKKYGKYSKEAYDEIRSFVKKLSGYVFIGGCKLMVAAHNNTDERYSLKSYMQGGPYIRDASRVYFNPNMDPDDFFYVTDEGYFHYFKKRGLNVVLQNNRTVTDDGSLSVYCGRHGIPYINVEAQHGHLKEQLEMFRAILGIPDLH